MIHPRWHLRSSLTLLLVLASAIAFLIAFALLLAYYQPRLTNQTRHDLSAKSRDLAHRSETVLAILQARRELGRGAPGVPLRQHPPQYQTRRSRATQSMRQQQRINWIGQIGSNR